MLKVPLVRVPLAARAVALVAAKASVAATLEVSKGRAWPRANRAPRTEVDRCILGERVS